MSDPVLSATFELAARVWQERDDLRERFGDPSDLSFWFWLLSDGMREVPELRETFYPLPGAAQLERILGDAATPEQYLASGLTTAYAIHQSFARAGFSFEGKRILDFGCGSGRVLRPFARFGQSSEFHGADIDAGAVEWCREHLSFAQYHAIPQLPPTTLPNDSFDAIYAFSVFSHLPEEAHFAWLKELRRLLAPGGLALLTVHGRRVVELWTSGEKALDCPTPEELSAARGDLDERGFLFFRFPFLASEHAENEAFWETSDLDLYGNTFVTRAWIEERWSELFEVVDYAEAPDGWQDFVLVRRRP